MPRSSNPFGRSDSSLIEELMSFGLLGGAFGGSRDSNAPQQPVPPLDPSQGAQLPRMPMAEVAGGEPDSRPAFALDPLQEKGIAGISKATGLQDFLKTQGADLSSSFNPWMSALFGGAQTPTMPGQAGGIAGFFAPGENQVFSDFGGLDAPLGK